MLKALRKKAQELRASCQTMLELLETEDRLFTDVEQTTYSERKDELDGVLVKIEMYEALDESWHLDEPTSDPAGPQAALPTDEPTQAFAGEDRAASRPFDSIGEQLIAIRAACDPSNPVIDVRLGQVATEIRAATGLSETVPSDGGFQLQVEFVTAIKSRMHDSGQIIQRVTKTPIGADKTGLKFNVIDEDSRADGSRAGGVRAYWTDEAAALTASKPKLRQVELTLSKLTGLMYTTGELMADAPALSTRAVRDFALELGFKTEDAFWEGDGSGKPLGIVGHAGTVNVAKEGSQAAATVVHNNLVKMWARMRNRSNAVWMINQEIEPQLNTISVDGSGTSPSYMPAGGLSEAPYARLFGRPVIPVEYASALGTSGDIVLCDWAAYESIDKGSPKADTSIHVRFLFDEEVFRVIYRVDGQPLHKAALTPFKGSATTAHFVTLATRS